MYYAHNEQIKDLGSCQCACHGGSDECECGWLTFFPRPSEFRTRLRSGNLESRVQPFGRRPQTWLSRIALHIHPPQLKPKKKGKDERQ